MASRKSEPEISDDLPVPGWAPEVGTRLQEIFDAIGGVTRAAKLLGIKGETLSSWRDGQRRPSLFAVAQLAEKAGKSLDWLVTGRELPAAPPATSMPDRLDESLLTDVIVAIDSVLNERHLVLAPKKKAALVIAMYNFEKEKETDTRRPVDRGNVIRLVDLAR